MRRVQLEEVGLIPEGVKVGEYMSLKISLKRGPTMEVLNNKLDTSVIEEKLFWIKR